jgi:D-alanyl-D-alanine carboxypeptidase/D-alanyl-D-alanine-endopeptidase (penicillin-binding protein 4)
MSQPAAPPSRRSSRGSAEAPARSGGSISAFFSKHPRAWLAAALGVAFLLLGTGAVFAGAAVGGAAGPTGVGPSSTAGAGRPVLADMPGASRLRTCSVAGPAADERLASLYGAVVNTGTGELLFDRSAGSGVPQGSIEQLLTAAAALNILGPDYTLSTRVFEGSMAGTIALVGGGDPTISRLGPGEESVYAGAEKLSNLAAQVKNAWTGGEVTTIILDATAWSDGDKWDETWPRAEQTQGRLSEVTALQVDGDRNDPTAQTSGRSTDPITRAGQYFARALDEAGVDIDPDTVAFQRASAITTRPLLGEVRSQPVSVLVAQMLKASDATLAESLARIVSKAMGLGGTAASLNQAISSALAVYEVPTTGLSIRDGSGTSPANAVPPSFIAKFMVKLMQGANNLNIIYDSLSVAGSSGTLSNRFSGDNADARGNVRGKASSAGGAHSLAGIITAADGSTLAFAFYSVGGNDSARAALDTLTAAVYRCGDNLANN